MRFLIDVVDLNTTLQNKYTRVLNTLREEAEAKDSLLVEIADSSDMIMKAGDIRDRRWDLSFNTKSSIWALYWHVTALTLGLALLKLLRSKGTDFRHRLIWHFAYSIEALSPNLRKRMAADLNIEEDAESRGLFRHWLTERGIDFPNQAPPSMTAEIYYAIQPEAQDVLVIAGLGWRYDMHVLKALKAAYGFKIVSFIYDLLPVKYPSMLKVEEYNLYKEFIMTAREVADLIVTPDHDTATRLRSMPTTTGKTARIELLSLHKAALSKSDGQLTRRLLAEKLDEKPFILCVSPLKKRKHLLWIYSIYSKLRISRDDFPMLVLAGRDLLPDMDSAITNDPGKPYVSIINEPSDDELSWLYTNSKLILYPSFEGGTGLPVREAIKFDRLCITSDAPSLLEIVGAKIKHVSRDEALWRAEIAHALFERQETSPAALETVPYPDPGLLDQIEIFLNPV